MNESITITEDEYKKIQRKARAANAAAARKAKARANYHDAMTAKQCRETIWDVIIHYDSRSMKAWDYFAEVYDKIPQRYRLLIQLDVIYTDYHFRTEDFFRLVAKSLNEEPPEETERRISTIAEQLKDSLNEDGTITIYRGFTEKSLDNWAAISYTLNRDKAEWFSTRFKDPTAEVITQKVKPEDILHYTNSREEQEVIIISEYIKHLMKIPPQH